MLASFMDTTVWVILFIHCFLGLFDLICHYPPLVIMDIIFRASMETIPLYRLFISLE